MVYCLRRDAQIAGTGDMQVVLCWGGEPPVCEVDGFLRVPDPRHPELGHRLYGQGLHNELMGSSTRSDYDALRVRLNVPETGVELRPSDTFILEAGFERLKGVDFRKGCYVGQEVTARMKHKTELRKGLVPVTVRGVAEPGTPIVAGGKPAGTLFTVAGGAGLAHLRLDRAGAGMQAGEAEVDYAG